MVKARSWSFSAFELLRLSEKEIPSRRGSRRAPTWACACPSTRPPRTAAGQIAALAALARELLGLPGQAALRHWPRLRRGPCRCRRLARARRHQALEARCLFLRGRAQAGRPRRGPHVWGAYGRHQRAVPCPFGATLGPPTSSVFQLLLWDPTVVEVLLWDPTVVCCYCSTLRTLLSAQR